MIFLRYFVLDYDGLTKRCWKERSNSVSIFHGSYGFFIGNAYKRGIIIFILKRTFQKHYYLILWYFYFFAILGAWNYKCISFWSLKFTGFNLRFWKLFYIFINNSNTIVRVLLVYLKGYFLHFFDLYQNNYLWM